MRRVKVLGMRWLALILGPVAFCIAGCGTSAATARAPARPVSRNVSQSRAAAYAKAVNLRPSDLPGFAGSTVAFPRDTNYGPYGRIGERCAGGVDRPGDVVGVYSPRFAHSHEHEAKPSMYPLEDIYSAGYLYPDASVASQSPGEFTET